MEWTRWIASCAITYMTITLTAAASPEFVSKSSDMTKIADSNILLSCKFKSNQPITFSWFKNGATVVFSSRISITAIDSTMQLLNIKRLQPDDAGKYTCVATNTDGSTSANIQVDVIDNFKPRIYPISDVYLRKGLEYDVECLSEALPDKVTYQWKKNSQTLKNGNIAVDDNILQIRNAQKTNEGKYECNATNSVGSSLQSFNLKIVNDTQWVDKPKDEKVSTTDGFEWVASIATPSTDPLFKWYKDGSLIPRDSSMTIHGAKFISRLSFPDLSIADAGDYKVTVERLNFAGFQVSMTLTVFAPPTILINEGKEMSLVVGNALQLTCNVEANPAATIHWNFNGKSLISSPANGTKVLVLRIYDVDKNDMGRYDCFAANEKGNNTLSVNVIIESKPHIVALKITVIVIALVVLILLVIFSIFFYLKCGERCFKSEITEGIFYTDDIVKEEKEIASLDDLENNPNIVKKNINKSIKRKPPPPEDSNILMRASIKKPREKKVSRQSSIFDTIKTPRRQNTVIRTLKRQPTQVDDRRSRLGSAALCAGKSINIDELSFDEIIGEGEYGGVSKGAYLESGDSTPKEVSIKMLKDDMMKTAEKRNMLDEIRLMRRIPSHDNIVQFIGWCVTPDNVYIIEEYTPFGNLLAFLRLQRQLGDVKVNEEDLDDDVHVNQHILLSYAQQIVSGMVHLTKLQIVHRDLACRNVYIGYQNTVQISDYAIVRDVYAPNVFRRTTGGQLPVRWMAHEVIFNGQYSVKSDVWSFGILLWELCTLGQIPYPNIMQTERLLEEIAAGYNMESPRNISTDLYLLMNSCWNMNPNSRPTFESLYTQLSDYINDINDDAADDIVHIDLSKISPAYKRLNSDCFVSSAEDSQIPQHDIATIDETKEEEEEEEEMHGENGIALVIKT